MGEGRAASPTITLDGSAAPISGEVTSIGMLSTTRSPAARPIRSRSGWPPTPTLFAGSDAQVAITLDEVKGAIRCPRRPLKALAPLAVAVLKGGQAGPGPGHGGRRRPGLPHHLGLTVGEQVILADLSTPLPTNTKTFAARSLTTGGGGLGGARSGGGATGGGAAGGEGGLGDRAQVTPLTRAFSVATSGAPELTLLRRPAERGGGGGGGGGGG